MQRDGLSAGAIRVRVDPAASGPSEQSNPSLACQKYQPSLLRQYEASMWP